MVITLMILALLVLLVIGVPIGFSFAITGVLGATMANLPLGTVSTAPYHAIASFPLLAIPFFILAGELMNKGKLIDRLVNLFDTFFHWLPGRLGHVTTVASAFLGAMTGSSVATVAAISSSVGPRMVAQGYRRGYVAALTASSGLLGVLIPPSIPLIIYGAAVGVSVADLFLATLVPGFIMTVAYMVVHAFSVKKMVSSETEAGRRERSTGLQKALLAEFPKRFWAAAGALLLPVIILGGIYSGITTATEAAAIAGLYALVLLVVGKMIKPSFVPKIFYQAAVTSGAIMVIIGFTSVFNRVLTLMQIPQDIASFAAGATDNPLLFLLFVNIALFLVGMFMETNAAVLLMAPLLYPAAVQFGIDPVHFGIILVTNIEIGLITPPMAANIYVSSKINGSPLTEMLPYIWRFLLASIAVLMLITYVPSISLFWFS